MSCNIVLSGRPITCGKTTGGIRAVWIRPYDSSTANTVKSSYVKYPLHKDSGSSFIDEFQGERNAGAGFLKTLSMMFRDFVNGDGDELDLLIRGQFEAVIERNTDIVDTGLYVGGFNPLEVTGGNIMSGSSFSERKGFDVIMTTTEPKSSKTITLV